MNYLKIIMCVFLYRWVHQVRVHEPRTPQIPRLVIEEVGDEEHVEELLQVQILYLLLTTYSIHIVFLEYVVFCF